MLAHAAGGVPGLRRFTAGRDVAGRLTAAQLLPLRLPVLLDDAVVLQVRSGDALGVCTPAGR